MEIIAQSMKTNLRRAYRNTIFQSPKMSYSTKYGHQDSKSFYRLIQKNPWPKINGEFLMAHLENKLTVHNSKKMARDFLASVAHVSPTRSRTVR